MARDDMSRKQGKTAPWRHTSQCSICKSPARAEIERLFLEFTPQTTIARQYRLGSRHVVARHARFAGLFEKRLSDVRFVLRALISRGMSAPRLYVPAAQIVAAAVALSKLEAEGRTVERFENADRIAEFLADPRWTRGELERYAISGELPAWMLGTQRGILPS